MGKIKQGILGGFSGKVAGLVGSSWKGIAVIKARPLSVANPRTVAQVAQRTKFSTVTSIASKALVQIIKPLWDRAAQQMSGYNAFVSRNIESFKADGMFLPNNFTITLGKNLKQSITNTLVTSGDANVTVSWDASTLEGEQLADDVAYLVVINQVTNDVAISDGTAVRSDDEVIATFATAPTSGEVCHAYLAFRSVDGFRLFAQDADYGNAPA